MSPDKSKLTIKYLEDTYSQLKSDNEYSTPLPVVDGEYVLPTVTQSYPQLYPYQIDGVKFLLKNSRCLLADDPGLGKTAQALVATTNGNFLNILIFCPKSVIPTWQGEIYRWTVNNPDRKFTICNWDRLLTPDFEKLKKEKFDLIIGDECQTALKSWSAKRCQVFIKTLSKQSKNIWLLSATPSTRSAADYHPILSLLSPGKWGKFKDFQERYCKQKPSKYKWSGFDYYGFQNSDELRARIKKEGKTLRRKKDEVLKELPDKIFQTFYIQVDNALHFYNFENQIIRADSLDQLPPALATLVRQTGEAKVDAVVEHALTFPDDVPLAIFVWHTSVAKLIQKKILNENKLAAVIIGSTPDIVRDNTIKAFQNNKLPVLVMNMQCGGVGLNLQNCSHCSFAELPWSPAIFNQAVDRFHRIGTKNAVNIYKFVAVNSIDEAIERNSSMKEKGMNEVMAA